MDKFFKQLVKLIAVVGFFLVVLFVGWWYVRWSTGISVFEAARDHVRDSLGLSSAVATVVATGAGIASVLVMTVLSVNAKYFLVAVVTVGSLGLSLAFLNDAMSAQQCFNRQTGKPLCEVWETPTGGYAVRRKDGAYPPSSWQLLRDATHEDARAYLPVAGDADPVNALVRVPHPVNLVSCNPVPTFFDVAGQAVVYWSWSREQDVIELWDRRGAHPMTGKLLKPMTPQIARKLCAKLAEAQRENEAKLARDQAVQAERETNGQPDLIEALRKLQEAQTKKTLDAQREAIPAEQSVQEQQRQQQANQSLSLNIPQPDQRGHATTDANLNINNKDCRDAYVYLDGKMIANVPAETAQAYEIKSGRHILRICEAGTSECSPDLPMDIIKHSGINYKSSKPGCEKLPSRFVQR